MKMDGHIHVALATAFSPRFLAGLAEAWRFACRFEASFSIVFAGESSPEKEAILSEAMDQLGIPWDVPMLWRPGDPIEEIVRAVKEKSVDLLVAGALIREREVSGRHFLGTVARGLIERSPSSLLLITKPRVEPRRYRRIAMVTDFSEGARNAFRAARTLAEHDEAECLHVLAIRSPLAAAREAIERGEDVPDGREKLLDEFASIASESPVLVEPRVLESATGFGAVDFLKSTRSELLVVPTTASREGCLLPPRMDWVSQVIPCDLWVVQKPLP